MYQINLTTLEAYEPWPLWEEALGIFYYSAIMVIGVLGESFKIVFFYKKITCKIIIDNAITKDYQRQKFGANWRCYLARCEFHWTIVKHFYWTHAACCRRVPTFAFLFLFKLKNRVR